MKYKLAISSLLLTISTSALANISLTGNSAEVSKNLTQGSSAAGTTVKSDSANRPMRILLTNDDGCKVLGITRLKQELEARGYDVWLSAPATNQSGIGTAITFKPNKEFDIEKLDDKSYCFPGTPSDALDFGLVGLLRGNEPDLVISGVNDGPNTGMAQVNSGTVGAAIRAIRHGYPAIAASIGLLRHEIYDGLPSTKKYWPDSVDYVVNMVDALAAKWKPGQDVLPKGSGLSINYPPLPKDKINGVKYIGNEFNPGTQLFYEILPNGKARQFFSDDIFEPSTADTDTGWLDKGYITYTVMDADWNGPQYEKAYQALLNQDLLNKPSK